MADLYKHLRRIQEQTRQTDACVDTSPRGFAHLNSAANPDDVTAFYNDFFAPDCDHRSWTTKRLAFELAIALLGPSFKTWCRKIVQSDTYGERHDDFMVDTITFIHTGKRELSVQNWRDIIPHLYEGRYDDPLYRVTREKYPYPVTYSMGECLSLWCAHPNGLQDMVCTLNILYGQVADGHSENHEMRFRVQL